MTHLSHNVGRDSTLAHSLNVILRHAVPKNLVFQKKRIYLTRRAGMETLPTLLLPATRIPLVIPTEVEGSRLSHSKERLNFSSLLS